MGHPELIVRHPLDVFLNLKENAMNAITAYALSHSYTDESIAGGGSIKGKNCILRACASLVTANLMRSLALLVIFPVIIHPYFIKKLPPKI